MPRPEAVVQYLVIVMFPLAEGQRQVADRQTKQLFQVKLIAINLFAERFFIAVYQRSMGRRMTADNHALFT